VSETHPREVSPAEFYDGLAADYDDHFDVAHRRAYDDLAWERTVALLGALPAGGGRVVDVGCGSGRWAQRLVAMGHEVVGVEPSPLMADAAEAKQLEGFTVIRGDVENVVLGEASADLVLAMGSVQYADDIAKAVQRMASWLVPGGTLLMLCDGAAALVMELLAAGKNQEAIERLHGRRARLVMDGNLVEHHLLDAATLSRHFADAGLLDVSVHGLLVGATALGRPALLERLTENYDDQLAIERTLAADPLLADAGKQLIAQGRR
jgi:SAM-dependent methyltransferase